VNTGVTTDIDGQSRDSDAAPDLGADEYVPITAYYIYLTIILK
jgi:hypothetical protein